MNFLKPDVNKLSARRDVPGLVKVLGSSKDVGDRVFAVAALGNTGDPRAVEPLLWVLRDANADIRAQSANSLGQIRDGRAVGPLVTALADPSGDVRCLAVKALGRIRDPRGAEPLVAAMADPSVAVRWEVVLALGEMGDARGVMPLIRVLKLGTGNVPRAAAKSLVAIGRPSVPALIAALADAESGVRKIAAEALGNIGDADAVGSLVDCLADSDWAVRHAAISALAGFHDERAVAAASQGRRAELEARTKLEEEYPAGPALAKILDSLERMDLPQLCTTDERDIKASGGIYDHCAGMPLHWRAFEGAMEAAFEHLWIHLCRDHPDDRFTYEVQSSLKGSQIDVVATTTSAPRVGHQHFIWRTKADKYVMMLSAR